MEAPWVEVAAVVARWAVVVVKWEIHTASQEDSVEGAARARAMEGVTVAARVAAEAA